MVQSDQDLDQLDVLLQALPAHNMPMTLSELDGAFLPTDVGLPALREW